VSQPIEPEGRRLVHSAGGAGLALRLFGGVAIWERSGEGTRAALGREYADLDFVAHRRSSRALRGLLETEGYEPERTFNAAHGANRLLYHAPDRSFHIDVFLDQFELSHKLYCEPRLVLEALTLTAADLLLAKLQVAEVNQKDLSDAAMLLLDHELSDEDGAARLNAAYVGEVCGADWGLYTTVGDNLRKLEALLAKLPLDRERSGRVTARAGELTERLEATPKTRAWKLRARVGRRKRWYEVPEEVHR